jgi:hypothetical protein
MAWIPTEGGYVNLDHATRVAHDRENWFVYLGDQRHRILYATADSIEEALSHVIPAAPGQKLHVFYYDDGELYVEVLDIIAWRISPYCDNHLDPIALGYDEDCSNGLAVVERSDGKFTAAIFDGGSYDTLDDVRAAFLKEIPERVARMGRVRA